MFSAIITFFLRSTGCFPRSHFSLPESQLLFLTAFTTTGFATAAANNGVLEDEDLAGLEDVRSEEEDDNYEVELTDEETAASGILTGRRPYRKKIRVDSAESLPLMEGEGRSFRVKGFNQNQRAAFVQIMMRFVVREFDWAKFTPHLKQNTCEEIKDRVH
ncbi:CHD3-type chromatin-remodeling factor PICKLE [Camellia lanceoleosa]|uniref:CHD3-type chromatin-remodeling factor PICKLE n=1 Tax=Camellia lanceoleosa TaxID=1840588 RepID=A0ACC0FIP2_9ERIC|nr:CHD3-type chromatin-remodeling factor PICKLE [Camellia lanceoleosa]